MKSRVIGLFFLCLFIIHACSDDPDPMEMPMPMVVDSLNIDISTVPYDSLSSYGFFEGEMNLLQPHSRLIPYDLNTSLFSNYALKQRFAYIPHGEKIEYHSDAQETLKFPDGSIIIKTFYYQTDFSQPELGRRILETRLLFKVDGEWESAGYIWNEEQTEATKTIVGRQVEVDWIHYDGSERNTLYKIPNKNDCKGCHELGEDLVLIGPKARNLNKQFQYASGAFNQLTMWESLGVLESLPAMSEVPKVATEGDLSASLNDRARAYLDINCAHCHNANGPANNTGLNLDVFETDSTSLGFCKTPVAAGGGSGGLQYGISPGEPDNSIMIYRLNSLAPDESMPELSRSVVHEEGMQLLRDWIESVTTDCN